MEVVKYPIKDLENYYDSCSKKDNSPSCQGKYSN